MKKDLSNALTGHRHHKFIGEYNIKDSSYKILFYKLTNIIEKALEKSENLTLISGMALGADSIWAYAIINMKKKYPDRITFEAHCPCPNQDVKWEEESKIQYRWLLSKADKVIYYEKEYLGPWILQKRNIGMIDNSDCLIAVYDNKSTTGGTVNAINYAKKKDKKIIYINPENILK